MVKSATVGWLHPKLNTGSPGIAIALCAQNLRLFGRSAQSSCSPVFYDNVGLKILNSARVGARLSHYGEKLQSRKLGHKGSSK